MFWVFDELRSRCLFLLVDIMAGDAIMADKVVCKGRDHGRGEEEATLHNHSSYKEDEEEEEEREGMNACVVGRKIVQKNA